MYGVQIAFKKYSASHGIMGSKWVGLYQFNRLFNSPQFYKILSNTFLLSIYNIIANFPVPIILALALNTVRSKFYKKTVQMVTYLPHFISTVVMVGIILQVFNPRIGLYGKAMEFFGLNAVDLIGSPAAFPHLYVWSGIWQNAGWNSIIYLAALSSVDIQQHEAAIIDGASRFQCMIHIDIPAIVLLIMNTGQMMNIGFEKVLLMQNDLNISASEIISTYSYKIGLSIGGGDFSYGAAIGLLNSVINFVLLVSVNFIARKVSETSLW